MFWLTINFLFYNTHLRVSHAWDDIACETGCHRPHHSSSLVIEWRKVNMQYVFALLRWAFFEYLRKLQPAEFIPGMLRMCKSHLLNTRYTTKKTFILVANVIKLHCVVIFIKLDKQNLKWCWRRNVMKVSNAKTKITAKLKVFNDCLWRKNIQ